MYVYFFHLIFNYLYHRKYSTEIEVNIRYSNNYFFFFFNSKQDGCLDLLGNMLASMIKAFKNCFHKL